MSSGLRTQRTGKYGMMTSFITETVVPARVIMTAAANHYTIILLEIDVKLHTYQIL